MSFRYFEAAGHASVYNQFRPNPPAELARRIVDFLTEKISPPLVKAIDVGCGGGQSTGVLASFFQNVEGFDPSESQITEATQKNRFHNVTYRWPNFDKRSRRTVFMDLIHRLVSQEQKIKLDLIPDSVGHAEKIDCPDSSVQLITAAQACHWFDLPKFYAEADRVLVPGGVLAMYGYLLPRPKYGSTHPLSNIIEKFYCTTLGNYVLPESKKVYFDNYRSDEFCKIPFVEGPIIRDESVSTRQNATVSDLVGYVSSWSAFQNYRNQEGEEKAVDILRNFEQEIMNVIDASTSPHDTQLEIQYNYFLLMGRKPLQ